MVVPRNTGLLQYKTELVAELDEILSWWMKNMPDEKNGGFWGSVDNSNEPSSMAEKGVVLNSRILWTFSAACLFTKKENYLLVATKAFNYLLDHFLDREYGGVYWSVDTNGNKKEDKKQVYGHAFCIYGFAEYYKVTNDQQALNTAIELFKCIEQYSLDKERNGYVEAFLRNWQPLQDVRLSEKDTNERKTMNTHLHILEAYSNLYTVWPENILKERIINLLELFGNYFINKQNFHLNLFFDDDWNLKLALQSFGHDIEASWLLQQCAEMINEEKYVEKFKELALPVADAALEGLSTDGGLWYEYDPSLKYFIYEKHSWPQAEAMIGFFNVWLLTGNDNYLHHSLNAWQFVKRHIKDHKNGEWFWGVNKDHSVMQKEKAGFWKCPYHSSRACIELIKRLSTHAD